MKKFVNEGKKKKRVDRVFTCLVAGSWSPAAALLLLLLLLLLLPPGEAAGPAQASRAPYQEEDQRVSEDRDNFLSPPVVVLLQ